MMDRKLMYAFRGWIAFVAFMDLGTVIRSYIEKRSFLSKLLSETEYDDGSTFIVSYSNVVHTLLFQRSIRHLEY